MFSGTFIELPPENNTQANERIVYDFEAQVYNPLYSVCLLDQLVFLHNETPDNEPRRWIKKHLFSLPAVNYYLAKTSKPKLLKEYFVFYQGLAFAQSNRKKIKLNSDVQISVILKGLVCMPNLWAWTDVKANQYLCLQFQPKFGKDLPSGYILDPKEEIVTDVKVADLEQRHQLVPIISSVKPTDPSVIVIGKATDQIDRSSSRSAEDWGSDVSLILSSPTINAYLFPQE